MTPHIETGVPSTKMDEVEHGCFGGDGPQIEEDASAVHRKSADNYKFNHKIIEKMNKLKDASPRVDSQFSSSCNGATPTSGMETNAEHYVRGSNKRKIGKH